MDNMPSRTAYDKYEIRQGLNFDYSFFLSNPDGTRVNLTGCTGEARIYNKARTVLLASFDSDEVVIGGLSTPADPVNGSVCARKGWEVTALWDAGQYIMSIDITTSEDYKYSPVMVDVIVIRDGPS